MQVFLIGKPSSLDGEVMKWLEAIGVPLDYVTKFYGSHFSTPDIEVLSELAGRRCYRSFGTDAGNPNVTKTRDDPEAYFRNVLHVGHESILEHGVFTFAFEGVSRVLTHELVRHRHSSPSQESGRYVRLTDIDIDLPDDITGNSEVNALAESLIEHMEDFQRQAAELLIREDMPFAEKKRITSALRRLAPEGRNTGLVWTANVRTLREVIPLRTSEGAEEEIRRLFDEVGKIMKAEAPLLFQDITRDEATGAWHKTIN